MRAGSGAFEPHLAPEESLVSVDSGTLVEEAEKTAVSIGVTDRRLLMVSDDDGFVDVAHDTIHAIRSRSSRRLTYREIGSRLLLVGGASLTLLAMAGTVYLSPGVLAFCLVLAAIGGVVAAEVLRRSEASLDGTAVERAARRVGGTDAEPYLRRLATVVDERPLLPAAAALAALGGFVGLVALTSSSVLLSLSVVALGGLAIVDAIRRQARYLDDRGERWRYERDVRVHLIDGRTVRFRVDAGASVDRELSRLTCRRGFGTVGPEIAPQ